MTPNQLAAALLILLIATTGMARSQETKLPGTESTGAESPGTESTAKEHTATTKSGADANGANAPSIQNGVPNREALATRVAKAHRPDSKVTAIDAFRSTIELEMKDATEDKGGQVALEVAFLEFQEAKRKRRTTLMRYEVRGAEQPIVRGQDRSGPWHISSGKPQSLQVAGADRDLKAFFEHQNLAKQLLRFLSPGDVIRSLSNCSEVRQQALQLTRNSKVDTLAIDGDIERFPMMQNAGEEAPARLTIYVDPKSNQLIAVDVTPLKDGKPEPNKGERIKFDKLELRNGVLVPSQLHYLWRDARGQLRSHSTVSIIKLDLQPGLKPEDFDRR